MWNVNQTVYLATFKFLSHVEAAVRETISVFEHFQGGYIDVDRQAALDKTYGVGDCFQNILSVLASFWAYF